jgi:hypothetical protein
MPNHVKNHLIAGDNVLDAIKHPTDPERVMDFNRIIPMPEGLKNITSDTGAKQLAKSLSVVLKLDWLDSVKNIEDLASLPPANRVLRDLSLLEIKHYEYKPAFDNLMQVTRNIMYSGYATWYEFATLNWGTKWNAYRWGIVEGGISFDTAWSPPVPVIEKLATEMFPYEYIEHLWADEDIGSNYGRMIYHGSLTPTLKDAIEDVAILDPVDFALTLWGDVVREFYRRNPNTGLWEYHNIDNYITPVTAQMSTGSPKEEQEK